jgi:RNA polymerase sigma-70 factor (ECF subfamily)
MQALIQPPDLAARSLQDLPERELVQAYLEPVHRFASLLCPSPADREDLAQEALIRAIRHRDRYDPSRGAFGAWLWRITLNVARDQGRAAGRTRALWDRLVAHDPAEAADSAESVALQRMSAQELVAAVHRLPVRHRTLVALRFGTGLSYRELAEVLDISEGAATQAVRRALNALRTELEGAVR